MIELSARPRRLVAFLLQYFVNRPISSLGHKLGNWPNIQVNANRCRAHSLRLNICANGETVTAEISIFDKIPAG